MGRGERGERGLGEDLMGGFDGKGRRGDIRV
jgi:hypothetical protein